ncbi:Zinc finger protein [Plakobranchus ocellatus]|uniref:Zinc finger protein n=1 Tax=Plakobranchus ocellatus TaxID=259542 RepID=A0AAV4BKA8_9GAST|nr:Zinc finger protein [Plakobranchus ocellatus]
MGGKEKTFHANLLKGYIARDQDTSHATTEERPPTSSLAIPAASVTVIEDREASTEELTSSIPVRQRPYPVPHAMRQTLLDELREMENLGVIRKSSSLYASPVVVVKKKYGTNRVCIDYRRLNKLTIFDPQPMTSR